MGSPTKDPVHDTPENRRSIARENDGARLLAASGYRIRQNPSAAQVAHARSETGDTGDPDSNPDYLLEDRVFDHYAPKDAKNARNIFSRVRDEKINVQQTQRVVIDLRDWPGDHMSVIEQFRLWPMPGLREAKMITRAGRIIQLKLAPQD